MLEEYSKRNNIPYYSLEDGFISYLGHPSHDNNRLSLILDHVGIYYDARYPSHLEKLCLEAQKSSGLGLVDNERAVSLIDSITTLGISKYNHERKGIPDVIKHADRELVLLVDQTYGDKSIEYGMANSRTFKLMLDAALKEHPDKYIVIKTHPDTAVAGAASKRGHYEQKKLSSSLSGEDLERVILITDDCSIGELFRRVEDVYVVTSQLGFEALLYGKVVHCFGVPFYAGWGLTKDLLQCTRRHQGLSLNQLVFAALVQYPTYLLPGCESYCEVEDVIDWLRLQGVGSPSTDICYAFGFSLWKRAFVREFVGRMARRVVFIDSTDKLESLLLEIDDKSCSVLLWGRGRAKWAQQLRKQAEVWFLEDGFLRSVGLGADLRRPSCLVIDRQGMYYDSSDASDIISILNKTCLSASQKERAEVLIDRIKSQAITKYNVGVRENSIALLADLKVKAGDREIIIVPGQFEGDLSIACSLGDIKTNIDLLKQVRADYPAAFIIFKEHPDVYSGVRPGALGEIAASKYSDLYLADIDMNNLLACCDRICTLTSLAGFEALLRNKSVTVYGSPFYAGWGLTTDQLKLPNRDKLLTLNELVYGAMIDYSRYIDWSTGFLTGPEQTVSSLAKQRERNGSEPLNSGWIARQARKVKYFTGTYFR